VGFSCRSSGRLSTHGISDGVSGFDGGSSSMDVGTVVRGIVLARVPR